MRTVKISPSVMQTETASDQPMMVQVGAANDLVRPS
jgi:hypothetical protein